MIFKNKILIFRLPFKVKMFVERKLVFLRLLVINEDIILWIVVRGRSWVGELGKISRRNFNSPWMSNEGVLGFSSSFGSGMFMGRSRCHACIGKDRSWDRGKMEVW